MIEAPIIKEQEALPLRRFAEPISYLKNSTLHNNSQNDPGVFLRKHLPLKLVPLRMI